MKVLDLQPKNLDLKQYKLRTALEKDYDTLITESTVIRVNGEIKVIYKRLDEEGFDPKEITAALKRIKYAETTRTGGLKTRSRIFGFAPRVTLRKDFCSATSLIEDFPKEHTLICDYAKRISKFYEEISPEVYNEHKELSKKVLKDWTIEDTPFTSGIINKDNPLKYHYDYGNFVDVYSCMLGFKHNVAGGYLSLPDFGVALEIANNSLTIFDGQNILHGVTPIKKLSEDAFRYTVVYYSLKAMWQCLPITDELQRIRNVKTKREFKRAEKEAFANVR